ncbi:MAG: hypothetical protein EOO67_01140 [Microbacterium sp.]|nr:MAG: hypothetical protein EOO67_01140 [Microbacterium sp.]
MPKPADGDPPAAPPQSGLWVSVVRAGGFAGLVRRWQVTATADDQSRWCSLIDACPWEVSSGTPDGADRFTWSITTGGDAGARTAHLAEHEVHGPWRALIDAVRETERTVSAPGGSASPTEQ